MRISVIAHERFIVSGHRFARDYCLVLLACHGIAMYLPYSQNALAFFAVWNCDLPTQARSEYEYGAKTQHSGDWIRWVQVGPDSVKREHDGLFIGHAYFRVMRYAPCRSIEDILGLLRKYD